MRALSGRAGDGLEVLGLELARAMRRQRAQARARAVVALRLRVEDHVGCALALRRTGAKSAAGEEVDQAAVPRWWSRGAASLRPARWLPVPVQAGGGGGRATAAGGGGSRRMRRPALITGRALGSAWRLGDDRRQVTVEAGDQVDDAPCAVSEACAARGRCHWRRRARRTRRLSCRGSSPSARSCGRTPSRRPPPRGQRRRSAPSPSAAPGAAPPAPAACGTRSRRRRSRRRGRSVAILRFPVCGAGERGLGNPAPFPIRAHCPQRAGRQLAPQRDFQASTASVVPRRALRRALRCCNAHRAAVGRRAQAVAHAARARRCGRAP